MRALLAGLVLLPCIVALSGCGTFQNTFIPCGGGTRPHVYGGVEIDCAMLLGGSSEPAAEGQRSPQAADDERNVAAGPLERGGLYVLGGGAMLLVGSFVVLDLALSFVGDTVTLPWVLAVNGFHGWELGSKPARYPDIRDLPPIEPATGRQIGEGMLKDRESSVAEPVKP
jgi:uncharacterized protein YceK